MARWLTLLLALVAPGCAHMEDVMFGPETTCAQSQPYSGCSQSSAAPNIVQTAEPPPIRPGY
jgi:hypothetical protein